jgi:hypothetical protein
MLVLPTRLSDQYPTDTGLYVARRGEPLILGPVMQDVAWHPLIPWFLVLGKLIHLRRLAEAESPNTDPGYEESYRQWATAYADQITDGEADDYAHLVAETKGVQVVIERTVSNLRGLAERCDELVERLFEGQIAEGLWLDPAEPLGERVDQVIGWMEDEGVGLEVRPGGYRDYLMQVMVGADGLPAAFPVSSNPSVLDDWITGEVIPVSSFPTPAE